MQFTLALAAVAMFMAGNSLAGNIVIREIGVDVIGGNDQSPFRYQERSYLSQWEHQELFLHVNGQRIPAQNGSYVLPQKWQAPQHGYPCPYHFPGWCHWPAHIAGHPLHPSHPQNPLRKHVERLAGGRIRRQAPVQDTHIRKGGPHAPFNGLGNFQTALGGIATGGIHGGYGAYHPGYHGYHAGYHGYHGSAYGYHGGYHGAYGAYHAAPAAFHHAVSYHPVVHTASVYHHPAPFYHPAPAVVTPNRALFTFKNTNGFPLAVFYCDGDKLDATMEVIEFDNPNLSPHDSMYHFQGEHHFKCCGQEDGKPRELEFSVTPCNDVFDCQRLAVTVKYDVLDCSATAELANHLVNAP